MAGNIKLNSASGGSITLAAYETSTDKTLTLPAMNGVAIVADFVTGAAPIPAGTTAQRPASPVAGMMRLNTTLGQLEYWNGTVWVPISGTAYAVQYLVVAGGGGGGGGRGGGGGAGGLLTGTTGVNAGTSYSITVGAGGAVQTNGTDSSALSITTVGGGGSSDIDSSGKNGGSGGGAGQSATYNTYGGTGVAGQGNAGGSGRNAGAGEAERCPGGGGGAGASGTGGGSQPNGGIGIQSFITGTGTYYAGGGGGSGQSFRPLTPGVGGTGGGGSGSTPGTANTGGGGGNSAAGGSGVVIIAYLGSQRATGGNVTSYASNGYTFTVHTFTTSGTFIA